jgi:ABC-type transport system involved in cytochrome c biogenesis permease subunit
VISVVKIDFLRNKIFFFPVPIAMAVFTAMAFLLDRSQESDGENTLPTEQIQRLNPAIRILAPGFWLLNSDS